MSNVCHYVSRFHNCYDSIPKGFLIEMQRGRFDMKTVFRGIGIPIMK